MMVKSSRALELRTIEKYGLATTFLGFGGIEIGRDWAIGLSDDRLHPSAAAAEATLKAVVAAGFLTFDTASAYHLSEQRFGVLSQIARPGTLINTKVGEHSITAADPRCQRPAYDEVYCNQPASYYDFSAAAMRQSVEASLAKLQVKTIDTLFLHFGDDAAQVLDKGEAVATLKALRQEGKIRFLGASGDGPIAKRCVESGDFDAIELEYNLLNQTNAEAIATAHRKGMAVFVRGGLGTGLLSERVAPYLAQDDLPFKEQLTALLAVVGGDFARLRAMALAFLYQNKGISSVIVGTRSAAHLQENIAALNAWNDEEALAQALQVMQAYAPGGYTSGIDAYFKKKQEALTP